MTVEERIARLERKSRRQSMVVVALLLATTALGFSVFRLVRNSNRTTWTGERIVLSDAEGRQRIVLSADVGEATVLMRDEKGRDRASLDVRAGGPGLTFFDEKGRVRVLVSQHPSGPFLGLTDERGKDVVRLPTSP
jgi:hypothetical protein